MKKFLTFILVLAMVLSVSSLAMAAGGTISGDGSAESPYLIEDADDLKAFADDVLAGNNYNGKVVKLVNDIDWNWADWYPLYFYGTFDGGNHTIKNLTYQPNSDGRMGFFQSIGGPAKNLTLENIKGTVPTNGRFGGFARYLNSAVENIHVKNVEVTTTDTLAWVGGFTTYTNGGSTNNCSVTNLTVNAQNGADLIAGFISLTSNRQLYSNCTVDGFKVTVTDTHSSGCGVGGFVGQTQTGWNNPKFDNDHVKGLDITASGLVDVGGFIAWPGAHTEYATNCTTQGKIDATGLGSGNFAGGFFGNLGWNCDLGYMGHKVTNCTADVDITTKNAPAGGFVGSATNSNDNSMYAEFTNCVAKGDITCVEGGTAPIGGFAGDADRGVYNNCSAAGVVTNNGSGEAGGFIGLFEDVTPKYDGRYPAGTREYLADEATLEDCQGSYYVTGAEDKTGGLIGYVGEGSQIDLKGNDYYLDPIFNPVERVSEDVTVDENNALKEVPAAPAPAPKSSGSGIKVTYNGGNSFSTSKSAVPTSVEIDGVPVPFSGDGKLFTVNSIPAGAKWVTVRWNSTSVTVNFTPSGAYFAEVEIPKTGDVSFWAAVAEFLGF